MSRQACQPKERAVPMPTVIFSDLVRLICPCSALNEVLLRGDVSG